MQKPLHASNVLILGLGESGLAMARWCARAGAQVTVVDTRTDPPGRHALATEVSGARLVHGDFNPGLLERVVCDAIYRSPGLTPAQLTPLLAAAQRCGAFVGGELDLFVQALAELKAKRGYDPAVVAVTGTNGKTTVTDLTAQLIRGAGLSAVAAGNISPSLLDALRAHLEDDTLPQAWVLELSSFQLDAVHAFDPTAATVLNITQDHLDWHGGMEAYVAAKARVFGPNSARILNRDDARVAAMRPSAAPENTEKKARVQRSPVFTFGADVPRTAGDFGLDTVNGVTWLVRSPLDPTRGAAARASESGSGEQLQYLMPTGALRIHGRHNALNALAALALALACGCALAPMLYRLREYRGGPHRVQSLGVLDGVEFFDDSKGTNVGATAAALGGLGPDRKLVVILGGDGKGQDFAPLAEPVARFVRTAVLIGRDAPRIREALTRTGVPLLAAATLEQAVDQAAAAAQAGDAVLLSPACASFDMFDNYLQRAEVFCAAVGELARRQGVELEAAA